VVGRGVGSATAVYAFGWRVRHEMGVQGSTRHPGENRNVFETVFPFGLEYPRDGVECFVCGAAPTAVFGGFLPEQGHRAVEGAFLPVSDRDALYEFEVTGRLNHALAIEVVDNADEPDGEGKGVFVFVGW
jgi:hypothetical protein